MDFLGKNVLVCGLARSGISASLLLKKLGANVTLQDIKEREKIKDNLTILENEGINLYLGKNPDEILEDQDFVVVSPGIPCDLPFFKLATNMHIPIFGEVELAFRLCKANVVAITGTNGKTTVTTLTGEIFKKHRSTNEIVGNIGVPFTEKVLDLKEEDYAVVETSSFQLETIRQFKPKISAVLNITPDHLDRHKTFENYVATKERIFENQGENDFVVLNYDDPNCRKMKEKTNANVIFFSRKEQLSEGIFLKEGCIVVKEKDKEEIRAINTKDIKILGDHNIENVMAAIGLSLCANIPYDIIRNVIMEFRSLDHRIEYVTTINDIEFYNDSKGTNVDCAIKSVEAMRRPIVLIGGGYDKGSDFSDWVKTFDNRVKHIIILGEASDKIIETCKLYNFHDYYKVHSLKEAIELAFSKAEKGDCILLSPACASWDMFDDYEQRGNMFKEFVLNLA